MNASPNYFLKYFKGFIKNLCTIEHLLPLPKAGNDPDGALNVRKLSLIIDPDKYLIFLKSL